MGKQLAQQLEEEMGLVADPALTVWVEAIGARIVRSTGGDPSHYAFRILGDADVNAFAIPGGYVYVTMGLLRFVDSEDELAAVVGHELGHLRERHGERQVRRDLLMSLALMLLRSRVPEVVSTAGEVGSALYTLKHSRTNEGDADTAGIRQAAGAGYAPEAMVAFLRKLSEKEKHKPSRFEVYFMTHPPTQERLAQAAKAPEVDPENLPMRRLTAAGLANRGLYRQALALTEEVLAREPGDASLHLAAALCRQRLGDDEGAHRERDRARALGAVVPEPAPLWGDDAAISPARAGGPAQAAGTAPSAQGPSRSGAPDNSPVASRAAVAAASEAVVRTHALLEEGRSRRIAAVGDVRRSLDGSKRRFRSLITTLGSVAAGLSTADFTRQEKLHRIALAVANVERALDRVEGTAEAGVVLPDQWARLAKDLNARLAGPPVSLTVVTAANALPASVTRSMEDLDTSLARCRDVLRISDRAIQACQTAARDLLDLQFLSGAFFITRITQIESRIGGATTSASDAAAKAEAAGTLADAADARRRIADLDLLGEQTPAGQRPAAYALLARRFGIDEAQTLALARGRAPYGESAASLLLGMAASVPVRGARAAGPPGTPAKDAKTPATVGAPGMAPAAAVKPVTLDEAVNRKMPLGPLNVSLRLIALDLARENGVAAPR